MVVVLESVSEKTLSFLVDIIQRCDHDGNDIGLEMFNFPSLSKMYHFNTEVDLWPMGENLYWNDQEK